MSARSTPYPPPGFEVRLPAYVWEAALAEVQRYSTMAGPSGGEGSEGLVYLAGVVAGDIVVVTSLLRLQHEPQGDRVQPSREQVRWLLSTLRARDEKLIAQLHTHRHGARHSPGDDAMATSFHEGFLSIVAPRFAEGVSFLGECIVHEFRGGAFHALTSTETTSRFKVYEPFADRVHIEDPEQSWWQQFVQNLRSIARKLR